MKGPLTIALGLLLVLCSLRTFEKSYRSQSRCFEIVVLVLLISNKPLIRADPADILTIGHAHHREECTGTNTNC